METILRAEVLSQTGRPNEAIAETKLTLEMDPLSLDNNDTLGLKFFLTRELDRAIEQERKVLELDPNFIEAYYFRGAAYLKKSMYEEGMAELPSTMALDQSIRPQRASQSSRTRPSFQDFHEVLMRDRCVRKSANVLKVLPKK